MRLGPFLFVAHMILFCEYIILFKFMRGKSVDICEFFFKSTLQLDILIITHNIFLTPSYCLLIGTNYFQDPFPDWIVYSWSIIFICIMLITVVLIRRDMKKKFCPTDENQIKDKVE